MSLLLDALKRAEQAKQENGEQSGPALEALSFDAAVAPASDAEPNSPPQLITRDRLPDISQSLEILTDDISPPPLLRIPKNTRNEGPRLKPNKEDSLGAQAQARRLFETKEKQSNPKAPFYVALGVLAIVAVAGVGYVWYQVQPRNAQLAIRAPANPPAAPIVVVTPASGTQQPTAVFNGPLNMIVPPLKTAPAAPTIKRPFQDPAPESQFNAPKIKTEMSAGPNFTRSTAVGLSLNEQAYAAFERGDLGAARKQYETALAQEPLNRDAMLGLAALDARAGDYQSAEARYLKVLEANPRDPHALAAMIALHGQTDVAASESRLKTLLTQQPDAAFLHFALGNLYAGQNRWAEAQQAYFKAYVAEPANADFAFNLAVSLDHMRQNKAASDYYRKALSLNAEHAGSFNTAQAETRFRELAQ